MKKVERDSIKKNFNECRFAFMDKNRKIDTKNVKSKKLSIKKGGVLDVIKVVKASDLKDKGVKIYDARTNEEITDFTDDILVIIDGQHRVRAMYELLDEIACDEFGSINIIDIDVLDFNDASLHDICSYITEINNESTKWSDLDYAEHACIMKPNCMILEVIYTLRYLKFSSAAISRYLFADTTSITNSNLVKASEEDVDPQKIFANVSLERGLEIICKLLEWGFSLSYIRHRYIIDVINSIAATQNNWPLFFEGITEEAIKKIEKLKDEEIKKGVIRNYLSAPDKEMLKQGWVFDDSEEHLKQNLDYIKNAFEKSKKKSSKKSGNKEPKLKDCK